jgi:hypothetical protein
MSMSIESLRTLVQQASHSNPHMTSRLEKAAFLVLLRPVVEIEPNRYRVMSEDGLKWYEIQHDQCECHDYQRHGPGHFCKHRLAVSLMHLMKNGEMYENKKVDINSI